MVSDDNTRFCTGCDAVIPSKVPGYQCPKCQFVFCHSCDAILHDSIHSCPGCLTLLSSGADDKSTVNRKSTN
ncbi:unnamed protein product [Heterobilharzia americana]|nr:unnamed protein product [Heterobilharzia americana]